MTGLPSGTVTFIFTDIEGSTRLWQDHPDAMARAYARHDAILESAIASHGGVRYKTIGDAFQVAFPTAAGAIAAAYRAQRELGAESWELPSPLRVRMAIHTGAVDPDPGGDYRSPALNRLGRLLGAGYGGQVLLSQTTTELCRDALPGGVTLLDLGEQRLKDLSRPERIFQLAGEGLASEFPALKTIDRRPNNLRSQPTAFIGREGEVAHIASLLQRETVRLVTATGPGGIGKTRLCLQAAAELLDGFPDGVFVVELAPIADPEFLAGAIAGTLRLRDVVGQSHLELLIGHLRLAQMLLVLDNFEHLLAAAPVVSRILAECPQVKVLASSRSRLRLRGEIDVPVMPLNLPDATRIANPDELARIESVRMFIERAQEVTPTFALSSDNATAIAEVCRRLDGLPLAIELAASRTRMLPPAALLKRLTHRLPVLTGGARDLPERQQTLRGAIQWSYELLNPEEQALFRQCSVFTDGATLDALAAVSGADELDVFDRLERLVDHSLIRQVESFGEPRYAMLETIREFGVEMLVEHGELDDMSQRHAEHFATLTDRYSDLFGTDEYESWIRRVDVEHDNMRAALAWSLANDESLAFRILHALGGYWQYEGHLNEAIEWYGRADSRITDAANRARMLAHHAILIQMRGEFVVAGELADEALTLFRHLDNRQGIVSMLQIVGYAAHVQGDRERARSLLGESLEIAREIEEFYELCEALNYYGYVLYLQGAYKQARPILEEAAALSRSMTMVEGLSNILHSLGEVCRADGDMFGAANAYREGLISERRHTHQFGTVQLLGGVAVFAAQQERHVPAIRILGAEEAHRTAMDLGIDAEVIEEYASTKSALVTTVGAEMFDAEYAAGHALSIEDAVSEALAVIDDILITASSAPA
jgi:predicted ATPase/class 3 adenylate cyclase